MENEMAVVLYLDSKTHEYFRKLSEKIAGVIGGGFMRNNQIPPHITISILMSEGRTDAEKIFQNYIQNFERKIITFSGLGVFVPHVLYAVPVMDEFLRSCNLEVVGIARAAGLAPQDLYVFGKWVPHLALASGLDELSLKSAFECTAREFVPVSGYVERIALTHCCPYENLFWLK